MRAGDVVLPRRRLRYIVQFTPSRWLSGVALEGFVGEVLERSDRQLFLKISYAFQR